MAKIKVKDYYEVYGEDKGDVCRSEDERKYSKWRVEEAYHAIRDARKALEDPKMKKYVGMCAKVKAKEAVDAAKEAGIVAKVGSKLKEVFGG